jgi:hypothetical protein
MKKFHALLASVLFTVASSVGAQAAFSISINGTVAFGDMAGWTDGQAVSFTWTFDGSFLPSANGGDGNSYYNVFWSSSNGTLISNVSGTGLTGSYVSANAPANQLFGYYFNPYGVENANAAQAVTDGGENTLGIFAPDSSAVLSMSFFLPATAFNTSFPVYSVDQQTPDTFFAGSAAASPITADGIVGLWGGPYGRIKTATTGEDSMYFTIQSATITVPEPSTTVLFGLGFLVAGGLFIRRRPRTAAVEQD